MKAVLVKAPMDFAVTDVPVPECPDKGLLLKVYACGLCGSDLRTLRRGHHRVTLPWIIGHEVSGTVAQTGDSYTGPWECGDMLSVAPLVFCGKCRFCRQKRYELCENYREIAQVWPGGFAEYIAVPEEAISLGTIQRVPENLDPAIAAVAEPVSSCVHAQEKGGIAPGETVVVMGAGPIGCVHINLARVRGAETIIAVDINEYRLKLCRDYQPDHIVNAAKTDPVERIRQLTDGRGADVIITANPAPSAQVQAVEMAAKAARILLFGGLPADQCCPRINTNLIHYNALHLIGTAIFAPRHHIEALNLLAEGKINGEKFITHRFPLSDFKNGVKLAMEGKVRKAVFLP